jgi:hypothetical protein
MITFKSDVKTKNFMRHLNKLLDYMEPEERRHYEENLEDDDKSAARIPLEELDKKHIYYSIRYIKEALK